ncbi:MAG: NTP transferase domain-containing protein [Candidatus Levybacteria bacterium]|nr:NTP transferase domain-containing protein [Candidatus Levybacteria bacterium]
MKNIVILAAGLSSRFWPLSTQAHKAFYKCGLGRTVIEETVSSLLPLKPNEIDIVVSPKDLEKAKFLFNKNENIKIFVQEKPTGEGDALLTVFKNKSIKGNFFLTTADKINAGEILKLLQKEKQAIALRITDTPQFFGIASLDSKRNIVPVVEKPKAGKNPTNYRVTSGYLLDGKFINLLKKVPSSHYSLEEALSKYFKTNEVKGVFVDKIDDVKLKFPWDLLSINKQIQGKISFKHIDKSAKIAKTAIIEGPIFIGKNAKIMDFASIVGPVYIGDDSVIGTHSLIRQNVFIDQDVLIGSGSEVKNSIIYSGSSLHRNYVGDSILEEDVKVGAGTVFANRRNDRREIKTLIKEEKVLTGLTSFGAVIARGTRIGINSSIMPGVKIGQKAHIWPASLVLKDVLEESIFK